MDHSLDFVPVCADQLRVQPVAEQWRERTVLCLGFERVELAVRQARYAGLERQAEQMHDGEDDIRDAAAVDMEARQCRRYSHDPGFRPGNTAGLAQARAEGRIGGRRRKLDPKKRREIAERVLSGRKSGAEMARLYDVSEPTVSRIVAEYRQNLETDNASQP
jgi:hypothetical protein